MAGPDLQLCWDHLPVMSPLCLSIPICQWEKDTCLPTSQGCCEDSWVTFVQSF